MTPQRDPVDPSRNHGARSARAAQRASGANEERYRNVLRALFETAPDAIITIGPRGTIESVNGATLRMFGYTESELCGANVSVLMPPEYGAHHDEYLGRYLTTGERHIIGIGREVVGRRKDGTTFPLELSVSEARWADQIVFTGIVRDISARKAVEAAARKEHEFAEGMVETAPVSVLVLDPAGRIVRFNSQFERLTGRKLADVKGADWFATFVPKAERDRIREVLDRTLAGAQTSGTVNAVLGANGEEIEIEWHNTALRDGDGRATGVLSFGLELTERRRLEQQFLQAQKMEAIGRLAGGVAHDFNNLLMGVIGCCRMAASQLEDSHAARALIDDIAAAAERGVALTRQLLTFGRKQHARPRAIRVNDVVERVTKLAHHLLGADVAIGTRLAPSGAPTVADPMQLEQVLMNLVVNARDAMPGGGKLDIETADVDLDAAASRPSGLAPGPYVSIVVRDTGVGMDASTQARIFEPFFTTKGPREGTGLGLSTVYGIVAQLGGRISVESAPGRGARFTVLLPRSERPLSVEPAVKVEPRPGAGETVLVVEDSPLVAFAIRHALEGRGYRVVAASEAAEAIAIVRGGAPIDLLLTDIVLPDLGGRELAQRIAALQPRIRVLYMSAHPNEYLVESGRLRSGEPSLEKPFSDERLAAEVRRALDDGSRGPSVTPGA